MIRGISMWGKETLIDLRCCDPIIIRSKTSLTDYVVRLVALIEMKAYGAPKIVHFGDSPLVSGYTLVQLIETSLISGHFVEYNNSAYINIFSCKDYEEEVAADFTRKFFKAELMTFNVIERGI